MKPISYKEKLKNKTLNLWEPRTEMIIKKGD